MFAALVFQGKRSADITYEIESNRKVFKGVAKKYAFTIFVSYVAHVSLSNNKLEENAVCDIVIAI